MKHVYKRMGTVRCEAGWVFFFSFPHHIRSFPPGTAPTAPPSAGTREKVADMQMHAALSLPFGLAACRPCRNDDGLRSSSDESIEMIGPLGVETPARCEFT